MSPSKGTALCFPLTLSPQFSSSPLTLNTYSTFLTQVFRTDATFRVAFVQTIWLVLLRSLTLKFPPLLSTQNFESPTPHTGDIHPTAHFQGLATFVDCKSFNATLHLLKSGFSPVRASSSHCVKEPQP